MSRPAGFAKYIALGDSMSIDLYPALDAGETDVPVALEWDAKAGNVAPLGAAALLYRNDDARYPEFTGADLVSRLPNIEYLNAAEDGATIGDVFGAQLPLVEPSEARTLVTLSVGGNDLLSAFANKSDSGLLRHVVRDVGDALEFLVETVGRTFPAATIVVTTVYDPSDGTRKVPGLYDIAGPLPLEVLHDLNDRMRAIVAATRNAVLADVHKHFLSHGVTAREPDRWYWKRSLIEPNARGGSEIRRVWLDALAGDVTRDA